MAYVGSLSVLGLNVSNYSTDYYLDVNIDLSTWSSVFSVITVCITFMDDTSITYVNYFMYSFF